jgi:hypothetical protein
MDELTKWFAGLVAGVALVLVTQGVMHFYQRSRSLKDKLIERYTELAGIAVVLVDTLRTIESEYVFKPSHDHPRFERWLDIILTKDGERRNASRDLARVALQIRMLEQNETLRERVKDLAKNQPFLVPGDWGAGNFEERFKEYISSVRDYSTRVDSLVNDVLHEHARANRLAAWFGR